MGVLIETERERQRERDRERDRKRDREREREYAQIKVTWKVCNFKFLLKFSDKLLSYEILEKLVTFIWSSGLRL